MNWFERHKFFSMYCLETVEGTVANKRGKEVPELVQEKVAAAFCSLSWVTQKVNTSQSVHSPLGILMNFVVTSIIIISSCILNVPGVSSGRIFFFLPPFFSNSLSGARQWENEQRHALQTAAPLQQRWEPSLAPPGGWDFQNIPKFPCMDPLQCRDGPWSSHGLGEQNPTETQHGFVVLLFGLDACFFVISGFFCYLCNFCYLSMLSLAAGVRTEQDLYVRLIDSVTKQVSRAVLSHPILPAQHFLGVSPSLLHLPLLLCSIADLFWRVIKNCALNSLFSPLWSAGFHPLCNNIYVIFMALFPCT